MPSSDSLAVPQHIAIVMDGNGRWANKRYMPRLLGHRQGVSALKRCVRACAERGVGALSVFAFSGKNTNKFCSITEKADSIPSFSLFSNIFLMFLFDIQKYCSIFVEVCDEK